ncbi:MAG: sulfotransferase [Methylococcales bacterium]
MKTVGVGLNRTGTSTLGVCLQHWGMKHISCNREALELWREQDVAALLQWVAQYDSFEDWPWPLLYREIDAAFPGTKFILTRRKDPTIWFKSLGKHADRTGPTDFRKYIYGHAMPHKFREQHIRFYLRHNDSVRQYFRDRPDDFIEVCWEEGDGWEELSRFLGLAHPKIPIPHANKSPTLQDKMEVLYGRLRHVVLGKAG